MSRPILGTDFHNDVDVEPRVAKGIVKFHNLGVTLPTIDYTQANVVQGLAEVSDLQGGDAPGTGRLYTISKLWIP